MIKKVGGGSNPITPRSLELSFTPDRNEKLHSPIQGCIISYNFKEMIPNMLASLWSYLYMATYIRHRPRPLDTYTFIYYYFIANILAMSSHHSITWCQDGVHNNILQAWRCHDRYYGI